MACSPLKSRKAFDLSAYWKLQHKVPRLRRLSVPRVVQSNKVRTCMGDPAKEECIAPRCSVSVWCLANAQHANLLVWSRGQETCKADWLTSNVALSTLVRGAAFF